MRRWGCSAAALALLVAAPSAGQDAPKSLLPDVFGAPPPETVPRPQPEPASEGEPTLPADTGAEPASAAIPEIAPPPDPFAAAPTRVRSLDLVGPLPARLGGYGMRAFADSNGQFLTELVNRIDPPLASRWAHIVLRRALLSRVPTPAGVLAADWVAARALLLLRMGEIDGAKLLVEALPIERYTPRLYGVASQVHLAAADIPALCPLAPSAKGFSKAPFWDLANGICAGIEGDDITAATQFDRLRAKRQVPTIDVVLAERVTTVTTGEGRGANVEWEDVDALNAYRFGMASAAGIAIPERLIERPGIALTGWLMRAPGSVAGRSRIAPRAAAFGIASANELAALAAARVAAGEPASEDSEHVENLRTAFAGRSADERIAAMRRIWSAADTRSERYARLVETAAAAARVAPSAQHSADAADLVASMLTAGYIRSALAWWPVLAAAPEKDRLAAWPLLALADTGSRVDARPATGRDWSASVNSTDRKAAMLGAAMQALGKPGGWGGFAEDFGAVQLANSYTRAIANAASARRRGEVALLAAIGLQSAWAQVSPGQLAAIVAGLRRAGFQREARMLAVEAVMRA